MNRCPSCSYRGKLTAKPVKHDLDGVAVIDATSYECPNCGETYLGIAKTEMLNREVANELARVGRRLAGHEIQWLRKYLGYSGADWAEFLGVRRETVSRWETEKQDLPTATERLLRMMVRLGPQVEEYGTPEEFEERRPDKPEFRQNSAGNWIRI